MKPKSVLLADTDPEFSSCVREFLRQHEVALVYWVSAIPMSLQVKEFNPDCVIITSRMFASITPEQCGQLARHTRVLLLLEEDIEQTDLLAWIDEGVADFLGLPINLDLLWAKIKRMTELKRVYTRLEEQAKLQQVLIDEKKQEEELARHVLHHISKYDDDAESDNYYQIFIQPSDTFNGDFVATMQSPGGNIYFLLLDATGHGLAAAISILPITGAFRAMVSKGLEVAAIAHELNRKIHNELPDDRFVAACLLEVNVHTNELLVWNAGMPDVLLIDDNQELQVRIKSSHLPLGILSPQEFSPKFAKFGQELIHHIVACSDGLIEQSGTNGELFGMRGLLEGVQHFNLDDKWVDKLIGELREFSEGVPQEDDITLFHLDRRKIEPFRETLGAQVQSEHGELRLELLAKGTQLKRFDAPGLIAKVLECTSLFVDIRQRAFTVVSELFNNALEHGVLGLSSTLKQDPEGFADYYQQREDRLNNVKEIDWVRISMRYDPREHSLSFDVGDSGSGFDVDALNHTQNEFSGRGLALVRKLAHTVTCIPPGNVTQVIIK